MSLPFLISCEQDVDYLGIIVFVVADIQWCVTGDLASSPNVPYKFRWMCAQSATQDFLRLGDYIDPMGINSEQFTTTFWSLTPFLICKAAEEVKASLRGVNQGRQHRGSICHLVLRVDDSPCVLYFL